ncbi:MAG: hypothetical protein Q4P28_02715 [Tissierellia bacterium]|nr:hypothetical protein [Tissierellia bacterium]
MELIGIFIFVMILSNVFGRFVQNNEKTKQRRKKQDRTKSVIPEEVIKKFASKYGTDAQKKNWRDQEEAQKSHDRKEIRRKKDEKKIEEIRSYYTDDYDIAAHELQIETLSEEEIVGGDYDDLFLDPKKAIIYGEILGEPLALRKTRRNPIN